MQEVQFVRVPEQVRQLLEHSQMFVRELFTRPVGQEFTHCVLFTESLKYPDLQLVQSVADIPQVLAHPASQALHILLAVFS